MDSEKERRQILNYLALLDEKLRYMFQNIDIEENLSEDTKALFFQYGKDIQNVIKDSEGNFSMLRQTLNEISTIVADNKGEHILSTADGGQAGDKNQQRRGRYFRCRADSGQD